MKRKNDEIKAKVYSLRTEKMELDRRILEMRSTIDSLKDEQKLIESALEEKKNEIRMLKDLNTDPDKDYERTLNITEVLKQKEAEIADLKRRLENTVKIQSVSTDDPSDASVNSTMIQNTENGDVTDPSNTEEEESSQLHENSTRRNESDSASTIDKETTRNWRDAPPGQLQLMENSLDGSTNTSSSGKETIQNGDESRNESYQDKGAFGLRGGNNIANGFEGIINTDGKVTKPADEESEANSVNGEEDEVARDRQLALEHSQKEESQDHQEKLKDGVKLESTENYKRGGSKGKGRRARLSRSKGKRWRIVARNRQTEKGQNFERNGVVSIRSIDSAGSNQDGMANREEAKETSNEGRTSQEDAMEENNTYQETKTENASDVKLLEPRVHEDSKDQRTEQVKDDADRRMEKTSGTIDPPKVIQDGELLPSFSFHRDANGIKSSQDEFQTHIDQAQYIVHEARNKVENSTERNVEQDQIFTRLQRPIKMEAEDDDKRGAAAGDLYRDEVSISEEEQQYKDETDESEF